MRAKDMVWPLWNLAWGGQRGFRTWDSLQSARKAAVDVRRAQRVRRMRVGVMGGREGMLLLGGMDGCEGGSSGDDEGGCCFCGSYCCICMSL